MKVEDGVWGAADDEGLQLEADAGRPWQRRRLSAAGAAVSDVAQSRRAHSGVVALAVEGMERTRVLGVALLEATALADPVFQEGHRLYGEQQYGEAAQRWGQAVLSQHAASHAFLSDILFDGRPGVAKDAKRAFKLAKAGTALGCAHSKGALGRCYLLAHGVAQNKQKALTLGWESVAAGSCFGLFLLGLCFDQGVGVRQDVAVSVRLFRLAAAQGHAHAQLQMGFMFANGIGVAMDHAEAWRFFDLAAAQGLGLD